MLGEDSNDGRYPLCFIDVCLCFLLRELFLPVLYIYIYSDSKTSRMPYFEYPAKMLSDLFHIICIILDWAMVEVSELSNRIAYKACI